MKNQKILTLAEDNEFTGEFWQKSIELGTSTLAGMMTFPTVIGLMQNFIWKRIGVSSHMKIAPVCGAVTLTVASACSALSFVFVEWKFNHSSVPIFAGVNQNETICNLCCYAALSVMTFKIFGGRLRNLCPSHILHPGAFAVQLLPLPSLSARVTKKHLANIQILGEKHGCHTCGKRYNWVESAFSKVRKKLFGATSRVRVDYFADHNPPVALAEQYLKKDKGIVGKLYPQCKSCSYFQASQVRLQQANQLKNSSAIVTHAMRMRLFKLWVPLPILFQYGIAQAALQQFLY